MTQHLSARALWHRAQTPIATFALLYLGVVVYFRDTLSFSFFQDDWFFLSQLRNTKPLDLLLGTPVIPPYFRPLPTNWLPWLNNTLWGPNPAGFTLELFFAAALLLYYLHALLRLLLRNNAIAWLGTLLFGFSNIWAFDMSWPVTGNIEIVPLMGYVASIYYFLKYLDTKAVADQMLSLLFLFVAIASKEYVFPTPFIFAGGYFLLKRREDRPPLLRTLAPSFCLVALWALYSRIRMPSAWHSPQIGLRPQFAGLVLYRASDYILPVPMTPHLGVALLIVGAVMSFVLYRRRLPETFLSTLALLAMITVIPALPIALVPYPFEYYSTASSLGMAMIATLLASGLFLMLRQLRLRFLAVIVSLLVVLSLTLECRRSLLTRPLLATVASQPLTKHLLTSVSYWLALPQYRRAEVTLVGMSEQQSWCLGRMAAFRYLFPQTTVKRADAAPAIVRGGITQLVLYLDDRGFAYTSPTGIPAGEIQRAKDLFSRGKFSEALPLYKKLVSWDEQNSEAQYRYAFCLQMVGRLDESAVAYSKALELDPALEKWIRYNRGAVYLLQKRLDLAERDLIKARALDPQNPGVNVYLQELKKLKSETH